jgi:hypothetical protein
MCIRKLNAHAQKIPKNKNGFETAPVLPNQMGLFVFGWFLGRDGVFIDAIFISLVMLINVCVLWLGAEY